MRIIAVMSFVALLSSSVAAQQPAAKNQAPSGPPQVAYATPADLAAIVAKAPKDRNGAEAFMRLAPYNVNLEHRVMVAAASVHEHEAELFYVIDGGGTIVTGGKLVEATRTNPENQSGKAIEGGSSRKITKGDFVLVPEGVPHWFSAIDGALTMMSLHLPRPAPAK